MILRAPLSAGLKLVDQRLERGCGVFKLVILQCAQGCRRECLQERLGELRAALERMWCRTLPDILAAASVETAWTVETKNMRIRVRERVRHW